MTDIPRAVTTRRSFIAGSLSGAGLFLLDGDGRSAPGDKRLGSLIFRDRFEREKPAAWGEPWFNQRYGHEWSVGNGFGRFKMPPPERDSRHLPNPILVLDHDVQNLELLATLTISDLSARGGLLARGRGYFNSLIAYLDGTSLVLGRCDYYNIEEVARKANALNPSLLFNMRFRVQGSRPTKMRAKIWSYGYPEPDNWQLTANTFHEAVQGPGAFGVVAAHSSDRVPTYIGVSEFAAYSPGEPKPSPATIVYSLAGVPDSDSNVRLVAKGSLPAVVGFEYGTDPTFTNPTIVKAQAPHPEYINRVPLDTSSFAPGTEIHWRGFAKRNKKTSYGTRSVFRTPPAPEEGVRFAFGSCTRRNDPVRKSFQTAAAQNIDFFIHQGDFGYVRAGAATKQADSYQDFWLRVLADPSMRVLSSKVPLELLRDDSEYGTDRATSSTLLPFTIDAHEKIHANPSNEPHAFSYGAVSVFCLDCRRYSTGNEVPEAERSRLGATQTEWLQQAMETAAAGGAGLLVVSSTMALGGPTNRPETWYLSYRNEWDSLMSFFSSLSTPVLIVSGNSHVHTVFDTQEAPQADEARIVEFISSGTEQMNWPVLDEDEMKESKTVKANAFGVVELGPAQTIDGKTVRSVSLRCLGSNDGAEWFRSDYRAVAGEGLKAGL